MCRERLNGRMKNGETLRKSVDVIYGVGDGLAVGEGEGVNVAGAGSICLLPAHDAIDDNTRTIATINKIYFSIMGLLSNGFVPQYVMNFVESAYNI